MTEPRGGEKAMKRIFLLMAVSCLAVLAAAQNVTPRDDLQFGEWVITSMTNDMIHIPDTDGFPYDFSKIVLTSIDGQRITDLYQQRFPILAEIRFDYENDKMRLYEVRVKVEYRSGQHGILVPGQTDTGIP
jgi:hypothetical protein